MGPESFYLLSSLVNFITSRWAQSENKKLQKQRMRLDQINEEMRRLHQTALHQDRIEHEKALEKERAALAREIQALQAENRRQEILLGAEVQKRFQNWPLKNLPMDILNRRSNSSQPFSPLIFLAPPKIQADSYLASGSNSTMVDNLELILERKLTQLFNANYPFGQERYVDFISGAWDSKRYRKQSSLIALHSMLQSEPTLVIECEYEGGYINIYIGGWAMLEGSIPLQKEIASIPYEQLIYEAAKNRATEWGITKEKIKMDGFNPEELSHHYPENESNLEKLRKEQALGAHGLDLKKLGINLQYQVKAEDIRVANENLGKFVCLVASGASDLFHLTHHKKLPLLPKLLSEFTNDVPDFLKEEMQKIAAQFCAAYREITNHLIEDAPSQKPDLLLQLANATSCLPNKMISSEALQNSIHSWLELRDFAIPKSGISYKFLATCFGTDDIDYVKQLADGYWQVNNQFAVGQCDNLLRILIQKNKGEKAMVSSPLERLRSLFEDKPEILGILDRSEILSSQVMDSVRTEESLFSFPINFFVTGRTHSGKTSLGNKLLGYPIMKSTGEMDCTSEVGYFALKSNLVYFDLPGAGGDNERYENINRAALGMQQEGDDQVSQIPLLDFTNFKPHTPNEMPPIQYYGVSDWQNTPRSKPDIIIYVLAPHFQFTRVDRYYLSDLLDCLLETNKKSKIIFTLNSHTTPEGSYKHTKQNLEDVIKRITQIYIEKFDEEPTIIEVNSITGTGFDQLVEIICQKLPTEKIGKMQRVLISEHLRKLAQEELDKLFLQNLIQIASRLARFNVDQQIGDSDLLTEAFKAVYHYALITFSTETDSQRGLSLLEEIEELASNVKDSRTETIYTTRVDQVRKTRTVEKPVYVDEDRYVHNAYGIPSITAWFKHHFLGDSSGRIRFQKQVGTKTEEEVFWEDKTVKERVGEKYGRGGYDLIVALLTIGLGTRQAVMSNDISMDVLDEAAKFVKTKLGKRKNEIETLIKNEQRIRKIVVEKNVSTLLEEILLHK